MTEELEDYSKYTLKEIENKIEALKGTIKFLREEIDPVLKKIGELDGNLRTAIEAMASVKYESFDENANDGKPLTKEEIEFVLTPEPGSMNAYRTAEKIVENKTALRRSGYHPETGQSSFELCFYKGNKENFDKTVESINTIFPYLKEINVKIDTYNSPIKSIHGIRFGIFEHTLSEGGVFAYVMENHNKPNAKYYLIKTTYSRTAILKEFDDFIDSLKYIEDNHYYEWADKPPKEYHDYDDENDY
jgi:hypothetical protein